MDCDLCGSENGLYIDGISICKDCADKVLNHYDNNNIEFEKHLKGDAFPYWIAFENNPRIIGIGNNKNEAREDLLCQLMK